MRVCGSAFTVVRKSYCGLALTLALVVADASAQDQFRFYFSGATAGVGNLGGVTFDSAGNFWVTGRDQFRGPGFTPRITKVSMNSGSWIAAPHVEFEDMVFFYRSSNQAAGVTNPLWGGSIFGTPASFLLNPAPLTITVPTGTGGTQNITYQPGQLAFVTDAMAVLTDSGIQQLQHTKKVYRYDLRKVDNPFFGISGPTSVQPDFDTAMNGDGTDPNDVEFGEFGLADWNDVFTQVISEQDLIDAAGVDGSDNWGRRFAWSSDGQSIYAIDGGVGLGGIYKIDASEVGVIERIWVDTASNPTADRIGTEPAVLHTSVRDFTPGTSTPGDQIIVEGSLTGGNNGGLNAFFYNGTGMASPTPIFTKQQFIEFSEYVGNSDPEYLGVAVDTAGNLYFQEIQTDGLYMYDTQGRFAKIASEAELQAFQISRGASANDLTLDLQARTSMAPGFAVTELVYQDDALDAPVGILAYKIGDFDRNNLVNAADLTLFAAALGTRGEAAASVSDYKFDLNGNPEWVFDSGPDMRFEPVTNGAAVVDWKDVQVLQQFTLIYDGDTNFDGLLNLVDVDTMFANYYTQPGQTAETWTSGDFASIDPLYAINAIDANLVNQVDLGVLADTWVNDLGQAALTLAQLQGRGYTTNFINDVLAAFAAVSGVPGDYNGDGTVNAADYTVWRDTNGTMGTGLAADGNNDGSVNATDYNIWRANFGSSSPGALAPSAGVPEPTAGVLIAAALSLYLGYARFTSRQSMEQQ